MTRPPLPPPLPPRPGLFRQTPPAAFTPVFGLIGLGLAWRQAAAAFPVTPAGAAEMLLGAATLLYLFVLLAYTAKAARRPGVIAEDLRILPGRGGLTAASLSVLLLAAVAVPYTPGLARALLWLGLGLHALLALLYIRTLLRAPPEGRQVTPVWHLAFVGFIIAAVPAVPLGHEALARGLLVAMVPAALAVWGLSARQAARQTVPPPLRPLLAIHAAPAALFASVAAALGLGGTASGATLALLVILGLLLARARWITAAGFSPLWGAFTFPAAAAASALLAQPGAPFRLAGLAALAAATLLVLPILWRVLRLWAGGSLGARTNAAIA